MSEVNVIVQVNMLDCDLVDIDATVNVVEDPSAQFVETDASRPAPGPRTTGPHRYTVVVPHNDDATFSVGQGSADRIKDTGITGRTKSHIHWHTTEAPISMLCLGGATVEGFEGHAGNNLANNSGFMMVTQGHSWIESTQQQYIISRCHDATLRSAGPNKRVVLQADDGEIDLVAKKHIYATSPGVTISAPAEVTPNVATNYQTAWTGDVPKTDAGKLATNALATVAALAAAHDLGTKAAKYYGKYKKGKLKRSEAALTDGARWAADAAYFLALQLPAFIDVISTPEPSPGTVKIGADSKVKIMAGSKASMVGSIGAMVGAGLWTTVAAGLSASLKGRVFAAIGGAFTAVKGYRKVEVTSQYGGVVVNAKTDVDITATGETKVGGDALAQLSSQGSTFINGGATVKIGCGSGDGTGIVMEPKRISFGAQSSVDALDSARANATHVMTMDMDEGVARINWGEAFIRFKDHNASLRGRTVEINAYDGDTKIDGKSVHIC